VERVQYVNQMVEKEVKKIIEVPVEEIRYEDRITKKVVEKVVTEQRVVPSKGVKEVPKIIEVPKVRYVDKIVQKKVKVPRNVYKDNIIEVEKTVYIDVPVPMDNIITDIEEKFTEVPVEIVRVEEREMEVPVEKVLFYCFIIFNLYAHFSRGSRSRDESVSVEKSCIFEFMY
jgi:hypothetical protein